MAVSGSGVFDASCTLVYGSAPTAYYVLAGSRTEQVAPQSFSLALTATATTSFTWSTRWPELAGARPGWPSAHRTDG